MSIRKIRDELKELRQEVEGSVAPKVVMVQGYGDDTSAGPPVQLCRLPGLVMMCDPRDAKL